MNATAVDKKEYFETHEIQPTDENIVDSLKSDTFGRYRYLDRFLRFIDLIDYPCVIAIDGQWGSGKTFFVKQAIKILEQENPEITPQNERTVRLPGAYNQDLQRTYLPVYYDAWKNDNVNDPLLSILHTIATTPHIFKTDAFKKQVPFLKKAARFVDMFCDTGIADFYDTKEEDHLFSAIESLQDFDDEVHTFMSDCIREKANKLVIFIDELDRCRPSFAVQLLERIKHYFSVENVIFVLSINSAELVNTVKAVYGQNFDGYRYLDRFIDFKMELPKFDTETYLTSIGFDRSYSMVSYSVLLYVIEHYGLSVRETEKYCRLVKAACGRYLHKNELTTSSHYETVFFGAFLPIMIGLKMTDIVLYREFVNGENAEPLTTAIVKDEYIRGYIRRIISQNFAQDEVDGDALYAGFFKENTPVKQQLVETVSLPSQFGSYND